jgi:formylglycine-generating enzyme required for sulfatase activity
MKKRYIPGVLGFVIITVIILLVLWIEPPVFLEGKKGNEDNQISVNPPLSITAPITRCTQQASIEGFPVNVMPMVHIPAGEFEMGNNSREGWDNDESPLHTVYLDDFYIDQYEVTNQLFADFLNDQDNQTEGHAAWFDTDDEDARIHHLNGEWKADSDFENHPVVEVTWYGARAYCEWDKKRLPTEAEWEKAARGTEGNIYPWGNEFDSSLANGDDEKIEDAYLIPCTPSCCDGYDRTASVGSFPGGISPYWVHDMAGNVWEWVYDYYKENYYSHSPSTNPIAESETGDASWVPRVLRGGSWNDYSVYSLRSSNRASDLPNTSTYNIGFRCAASTPP